MKNINIDKTVKFVAEHHASQFRKGSGLPYVIHPMTVLYKVSSWGIKDEDIWNESLCHDLYEECPNLNKQDLLDIIGTKAESVVSELTFIEDINSELTKQEQKQQYMDSFKNKSIESLIVKIADRCCNTLDFLLDNPSYAKKYWEKAENLISLVYSRQREIIRKYGMETYGLIIKDLDLITLKLNYYE